MTGTVSVERRRCRRVALQPRLQRQTARTLEGVWLIQLTPDERGNSRRHQALVTFHADGTVDADFSAGTRPTVPPPPSLTPVEASGCCKRTVCRMSLIALMNDADQRFAGTATFEAEAQLDADGRAFDGTFEFAVVTCRRPIAGQRFRNAPRRIGPTRSVASASRGTPARRTADDARMPR